MPRGKAAAGGAAKKQKGPKGHQLAEKFHNGEVLRDLCKKNWRIGDVVGQGGFGLIYLATDEDITKVGPNAKYVIKIEPIGNGPLFCEQHFYQRVAKPDLIDAFVKKHKLRYLGVPRYVASGQHVYNSTTYRFMVMDRFSLDLQKLFEGAGKQFSQQTVYALALRLLDALEYLHEMNYVHADIKASNCLLGFKANKVDPDSVYLVDYGLATKYNLDTGHRVYKEDPRKAHDGTIEFTSRDAHKGVDASRRSDLEILGYCLLQWLCGRLPWEDKLTDPNYVSQSKIKYMDDIPSLMKKCFPKGAPDEISTYFKAVVKINYDEKPDYKKLRDIFQKGLNKVGVKDTWKLALPIDGAPSKSPKKGVKRPSSGTSTDIPAKQKARMTSPCTQAKPSTSKGQAKGTPKAQTKPATPRGQANRTPKGTPKAQAKQQTPKGTGRGTPKTKTKQETPKAKGRAAAPKGRKTVPGNPPQSKAASPSSSKAVGKRVIEMTSPLNSPQAGGSNVNGGHQFKRRKVIRRKNVQLQEMAVQTSPGLKLNR